MLVMRKKTSYSEVLEMKHRNFQPNADVPCYFRLNRSFAVLGLHGPSTTLAPCLSNKKSSRVIILVSIQPVVFGLPVAIVLLHPLDWSL